MYIHICIYKIYEHIKGLQCVLLIYTQIDIYTNESNVQIHA